MTDVLVCRDNELEDGAVRIVRLDALEVVRHDQGGGITAGTHGTSDRCRHRPRDVEPLPLRHLRAHPPRGGDRVGCGGDGGRGEAAVVAACRDHHRLRVRTSR
jgi:hypothetical protein